ncbi:hypothetical protein FA13DRAFT_1785744 [Coprinellus micaceus]|uniref:Uncharacterized protein n=1 Tax=Coprinellus micaceus TaxID=71717 RepID=A0A4Y7TW65_COPMI|nr:hypothetical protein FA13DRAFT_1785744 [Coprinellus micaceus]
MASLHPTVHIVIVGGGPAAPRVEAPADWKDTSGIDWAKPQKDALTDFVHKNYSQWIEDAKKLVFECDEGELALRPLYQYPPRHKLERALTGVNLAMHDSYDLALAIAIGGSAIDTALDEYEKTMFARASENVEEVVKLLIRAFSGDE